MLKLNNIRRFVAFLAIFATLLVTATILIRMQRGKSLSATVGKLPVQIDVSLQAIRFTETRQGVKQWDLKADRAEYDRDKKRTSLSRVNLVILNSSAGQINITADRADYDHTSKDVSLSGNVQGKSTSGLEFSAPGVNYVASRETLESPGKVTLKNAGLTLEGVGMELHTKNQKLKLSQVSAEAKPGGLKR